MDIYQEQILDHYRNRRNFGHLDKPSASLELTNSLCGDSLGMEIKFKIQNSKFKVIEDIRFWGEGCAISQATASMLTEKVKGKTFLEIEKLKYEDLKKMLGIELSPARMKCALLPLEVLQKVIKLV